MKTGFMCLIIITISFILFSIASFKVNETFGIIFFWVGFILLAILAFLFGRYDYNAEMKEKTN